MEGKSYRWTQPACDDCYHECFPNVSKPSRMIDVRDSEVCVYCGFVTFSGLYVRVDPYTVPHPTLLKS